MRKEDFRADGLDVWFPDEVKSVIASRPGTQLFYASLMRRSLPHEEEAAPWWPHTLHKALTDSAGHAREMVVTAYEALVDRPGER